MINEYKNKTRLLLKNRGGGHISRCNLCGKNLDFWDQNEDFSWTRHLGYGTKYDGNTLNLHLCCECIKKIIEECTVSPIVNSD